jgi:hypothetical protein
MNKFHNLIAEAKAKNQAIQINADINISIV